MTENTLRLTRAPEVRVGGLIRRPPGEVFRAFADPEVTTRFWFTGSSGRLAPGARVRWEWEMYGASTQVTVKEFEQDRRIVFEWNPDSPSTVELRFFPVQRDGDATYVRITESGLGGDGDAVAAHLHDSAGGFTNVLCSLKALLEHDIELNVVLDHYPEGLDL